MNTNNSQSNQTESTRIKPTKDYVYPRIEPPPNHRSTQPEPNWTNNPPPNTHKRPNACIPSTNPRKPNTQTMSNPKNPINCWIPRPEKSKIQSITEHPHQKEDESSEKRGKNEKKKHEPKNPMQRNREKAEIGAKKGAKAYLIKHQERPEASPRTGILARPSSREPYSPSFSLPKTKEPSRDMKWREWEEETKTGPEKR